MIDSQPAVQPPFANGGAVAARSRFSSVLSLDDFQMRAARRLPSMVYSYVAGAAETGAAAHTAAEAYVRYSLVPRTLVDVSVRDQRWSIFGERYASAFGIAPMGGAAIAAYRGDIALARSAAQANVPMIMSGSSLIKLEEVHRENPKAWFQAYLVGEQGRIDRMVDRVAAAGFATLVVTVDVPVFGNREEDRRSGFSLPIQIRPKVVADLLLHPAWLFGTLGRTLLLHGMPHFENNEAEQGPPLFSNDLERNFSARERLAWRHIEAIRRRWAGNLVLKGILSPTDVKQAIELGADGVILSNHGGRQLDYAIAPLRVLPEIVAETQKVVPIMIDGGIRRGTDVLKALALGADFVFVGRPFLFAAALGGSEAVLHAIRLLMGELDRDLALLGLTSLGALTPDVVRG